MLESEFLHREAAQAYRSDRSVTEGAAGGMLFDSIDAVLKGSSEYRAFRAGSLSRTHYDEWVIANLPRLVNMGLAEDAVNYSTRFPQDEVGFVESIVGHLRTAGLLPAEPHPEPRFADFCSKIEVHFEHGGRFTYIFPEEARLLFSLAHQLRPRTTVFLGSYYGYWAVWALPGVVAAGGRAILIDIDPNVMALAERNLRALGFDSSVDFAVADAIEYLRHDVTQQIDLCVLDADGPLDAVDPDLRYKAIYFPMAEALTPKLRPGGTLIAHNMLLENLTANPYFSRRIEYNQQEYKKFFQVLRDHYDLHHVFPTTQGVGIYRKALHRSDYGGTGIRP